MAKPSNRAKRVAGFIATDPSGAMNRSMAASRYGNREHLIITDHDRAELVS
jgi:hypothetical protein